MRYLPLLEEIDRWQRDAAGRHPGIIPCRPGCAACCLGPFDISAADVATLQEGLAQLPDAERADIRRRAAAQLARVKELEPRWAPPYDIDDLGEERFDRLSDALHNVPCPVLDDGGRCRLYAHRPLVCRMMGLGMGTALGEIENDCPIQDNFPAYAALAPQWFDLDAWEQRETLALEATGRPQYETFIAAVVA